MPKIELEAEITRLKILLERTEERENRTWDVVAMMLKDMETRDSVDRREVLSLETFHTVHAAFIKYQKDKTRKYKRGGGL